MNRPLELADVRHRRTDGVSGGTKATKLEALLITVSHELTHAIMYIACPAGSGGHTQVFRDLNYILWGHSKNIHTYIQDGRGVACQK